MISIGSSAILSDIGIIGSTQIKARLGRNIFSALKFNSTSFNHSNSKFNILILVTTRSHSNSLSCNII